MSCSFFTNFMAISRIKIKNNLNQMQQLSSSLLFLLAIKISDHSPTTPLFINKVYDVYCLWHCYIIRSKKIEWAIQEIILGLFSTDSEPLPVDSTQPTPIQRVILQLTTTRVLNLILTSLTGFRDHRTTTRILCPTEFLKYLIMFCSRIWTVLQKNLLKNTIDRRSHNQ